MRARHETTLHRLVLCAIPSKGKDILVEQAFSPNCLRPYVVALYRATKNIIIVDVIVPYEGGEELFTKARFEKEQKYSRLRAWMKDQQEYNSGDLYPFMVGVGE